MDWANIIEAAAMAELRPDQTFRLTLPELRLVMRGWQRAHGLEPDKHENVKPMSRARLIELAKRYGSYE